MDTDDPKVFRSRWKRPTFKRTSQGAKLVGYGFLFCVLLAVVMKVIDYFMG